jgi:hypothetical protein
VQGRTSRRGKASRIGYGTRERDGRAKKDRDNREREGMDRIWHQLEGTSGTGQDRT